MMRILINTCIKNEEFFLSILLAHKISLNVDIEAMLKLVKSAPSQFRTAHGINKEDN